jgi:hypothetical protein
VYTAPEVIASYHAAGLLGTAIGFSSTCVCTDSNGQNDNNSCPK